MAVTEVEQILPEIEDIRIDSKNTIREPKNILVAEDNESTYELLEYLLTQRGHEVDVVVDGREALAALQKKFYDVVLMDFHLPKMDGLQVASAFKALEHAGTSTRFVAITADMKGLLGNAAECKNFDDVMAKPFDLDEVCRVIEHEDRKVTPFNDTDSARSPHEILEYRPPVQQEFKTPAAPAVNAINEQKLKELDLRLLHWPSDFVEWKLSTRARQAMLRDGGYDAIVINQQTPVDALSAIWQTKALHLIPVIDLTGTLGRRVDVCIAAEHSVNGDEIRQIVETFTAKRDRLHRDYLYTDELEEKLLGRIFLSDEKLSPFHSPESKRFVGFNTLIGGQSVELEAEKLCNSGFLEKRFFDRLHQCNNCKSSRFNVREECAECRSANLAEEPYLHHFKCAYQGLESDFRDGEDLICPKCRRELSHYSIDYDKPGNMIKCNACDHASSEPAIGLICIDCGTHSDGDLARTCDIHSYHLTERGVAVLEAGRESLGKRNKPSQFSELPLELVVAVNRELKNYEAAEIPFVILDLSYRNARELELEHGARQFQQSRTHFLENLHNLLPRDNRIIQGQNYDFVFLTETEPEEIRGHLKELRKDALDGMRLELDVAISVYGPESFV